MTLEENKERLPPVDEALIRYISRLSSAERIQRGLDLQEIWLGNLRAALRKAHPDLSDYELTLLMFEVSDKYSEKYGYL